MDEYCGCCGRLIDGDGHRGIWCRQCAKHVRPSGPFESRTYFAQHKRACPWKIGTWNESAMEDAGRLENTHNG